MRKVRVVVEIEVPDNHDLTEKKLVWAVRRKMGLGFQKLFVTLKEPRDGEPEYRSCDVKEYSRVVAYRDRMLHNG